MSEIYKLPAFADDAQIVSKLNEVIDVLNGLTKPPPKYAPEQKHWMDLVLSQESSVTIDEVARIHKVEFYDDVPHHWQSPVYCSRCQMRSSSLLDRLLVRPDACEGCKHKSAWG